MMKFYCPWCCAYTVAHPCEKHKQVDATKANYCRKCMHFFETASELEYHSNKCLIQDNNVRPVKIPAEEKVVEFDVKHYNRTYMLPVTFVADFESTLVKLDERDPDYHKQGTKIWKGSMCPRHSV